MAVNPLNQYLFMTNESWLTKGVPRWVLEKAGPAFRALQKAVSTNWTGDFTGKNPVRSQLEGNGGPAYSRVLANAVGDSGQQFDQPISEHWVIAQLTTKFLSLLKSRDALQSGMTGLDDKLFAAAEAWARSMSALQFGDGRGALACGNGAYNVAGNQIIFLNEKSTINFQVGQVLRLVARATYDAANPAPTTMPAARTGSVRVSKRLRNGVEIVNTTTGAATTVVAEIPAAVNTDVITLDSFYPAAADVGVSPLYAGFLAYLADSETQAVKTLYGVDRSIDPEYLAGRRVGLTGSESPYDICAAILQEAVSSGSEIDCIYVPASQVKELIDEFASRQMLTTDVKVGLDNPQNFMMGFEAAGIKFDRLRCAIVADPFNVDPFVTVANDKRYIGVKMADWTLETAEDGVSWKDYEGNGTYLKRDPNSQVSVAEYGMYGALVCHDTGHQIIAKVGADS